MGNEPFIAQIVRTVKQYLYAEGYELTGDDQDIYMDAADALSDLLAYWNGREED